MKFKNEDQLKSYLKNESKRLNISINNTYNTFFAKRLLSRVSNISYGKVIVKGSFSELAHLNQMIRPITDIDLVTRESHNNPLLILYQAMYEYNEDNIVFKLTNLPKRTKTGIYKIPIAATFGNIRHSISIDFMEKSKTLYDLEYKRIESIFINEGFSYICVPTYEEHLAEKLCIVAESVKLDVLNTRVKDFYDIYKLYGGKYDKDKLNYYFNKMIVDRGKIDPTILSTEHLNKNFLCKHQLLWNQMSKKYEFMDKSVEFEKSVSLTKKLLNENIDEFKKIKVHI